ncbi:MAG TPA: SDR family NAD(P)-dependent oxidoreductase [Thermoanaerobaculia bacterium]|nr:SDR family NAD(P)-dependent oxidoreductase [Thermoanaerobaculia bacterium]
MKNAIITGGSSGIGLALANELVTRGYRVALLARRLEHLEREASRLRESGAEVVAVQCDVTLAQEVRSGVQRVVEQWGPIDLVIANAGLGLPTPAVGFDLGNAEAMMRTNFFGMIYLFDAVVPSMIERRTGHFAGIASLAGLRGLPTSGVYSASKAAMQAFLEAVRVELAQFGVAVTIVNPGFVRTDMTSKNNFTMPFLMEADDAAARIVTGLERRCATIEFPLGTSLMMRFARALPTAVFDRVMRGHVNRETRSSLNG